jgi:hypothetical protein
MEDVLVAGFGHKADLRPFYSAPAGTPRLQIEAEAIRPLMDEQHEKLAAARRSYRTRWKFR